jgi:hypothetical protein
MEADALLAQAAARRGGGPVGPPPRSGFSAVCLAVDQLQARPLQVRNSHWQPSLQNESAGSHPATHSL